jgi:glycine/D-amino acid oxidase-like deaminating enzyme
MTAAIYHPSLYDRQTFHSSYWAATAAASSHAPLAGDAQVEVAIIGGGYAGLSSALHLARDHGIQALVLEAGAIGWGASGRNAGFNTLPASKLAAKEVFQRWPEADARAFFAAQREGQALVYQLAAEENFDLQACGRGIFQVAHSAGAHAELAEEGRYLARAGISCQLLDREEFAAVGHGGPDQFGALHMLEGGGINPLQLTHGLAAAAARHGARICAHSPMRHWRKHAGWHELVTPGGTVRARQVVLASNAYRDGDEPAALRNRVLPAISNILVTRPLSEAQWQAIGLHSLAPMSDTRMLVSYYRRLADGRLLFGARSDTWGDPRHDGRMRAALERLIRQKFPDCGALDSEFFWRGLVSVTRKLVPTWGRVADDPSVLFNLGCFGSGVNTAAWLGRAMARSIAGQAPTATENSAVFRQLPPPLPGSPWLQRKGLQLAYLHYALQDRLQ